jgi:GNAT superfamily N-acetyltransferase
MRLRALAHDPNVFGSSHAREHAEPDSFWTDWATASEDGSRQRTFVCVGSDGDWLGMAMVRSESDVDAVLNAMWVAPGARGLGMASALCDACSDWARARGHIRLNLTVLRANDIARKAYEGAGFALISEFTFTREDGTRLDKLAMARPLLAASSSVSSVLSNA